MSNSRTPSNAHILYTFRRCPYAIRARLGLVYAKIEFEHREVDLKNKPSELLEISAKATVPVLQLTNGVVIDQSIDILEWAVANNDPDGWKRYSRAELAGMKMLIEYNDFSFKPCLDYYKYADRFPGSSQEVYKGKCLSFLEQLEARLEESAYLFSETLSYADCAIFPFIRQFSKVDEPWFAQCSYPAVKRWLNAFIKSELFLSVMEKHKPWKPLPE